MRAVRFSDSLTPLLVPIGDIQQHPRNPNNGDIDALVESIKVNGFITAITVDRSTGYIIAGNHRWQALHSLGATHIPVIWADSDDQGKRYLVTDNRISELAKRDPGLLSELIQELQETDLGLLGSGYTDEEAERLLMDLANLADMPPDGAGFGQAGAMGIYQTLVEFDNEDDRDTLDSELRQRFERVRTVNL